MRTGSLQLPWFEAELAETRRAWTAGQTHPRACPHFTFETEILTTRKNLKSLMDVPGKWIDRVRQHRALDKLILDLDPGAPG